MEISIPLTFVPSALGQRDTTRSTASPAPFGARLWVDLPASGLRPLSVGGESGASAGRFSGVGGGGCDVAIPTSFRSGISPATPAASGGGCGCASSHREQLPQPTPRETATRNASRPTMFAVAPHRARPSTSLARCALRSTIASRARFGSGGGSPSSCAAMASIASTSASSSGVSSGCEGCGGSVSGGASGASGPPPSGPPSGASGPSSMMKLTPSRSRSPTNTRARSPGRRITGPRPWSDRISDAMPARPLHRLPRMLAVGLPSSSFASTPSRMTVSTR